MKMVRWRRRLFHLVLAFFGLPPNHSSNIHTQIFEMCNYGNGFSSKSCSNGSPVFLQKDFDGVANIFAPNIIIQNPPLTSDGYPDISYRM